MAPHVDVIATTISGSVADWGKVGRIVPLFREHGFEDVALVSVDSHAAARAAARDAVARGGRILISAGGSGTFNAVLEGGLDAGAVKAGVCLGFLRKGSADLIGKVLGMPDRIEAAVEVFVRAIREGRTVGCDILRACPGDGNGDGEGPPRHFVGYGGAEIFGRIPRYTENRFMRLYKGLLGQLFGDLGPFFVGMSLAVLAHAAGRLGRRPRRWRLSIDGTELEPDAYQAMILANGDLGPDLPYARGVPLGSGDFHLFTVRDLGLGKLPGQLRHAWDASILEDPSRWGFRAHRVTDSLLLASLDGGDFPLNVDGSTLECHGSVRITINGRIDLLSA